MPTPEQIAEGRRLKAAANEALEMGERFSVMEGLKAVDAWDRWLDGNMDALLDAAERAEAAERELAEAQESLQAGRDLMAVVHGDGGHYREQYGDRKASEDAITIVGALRAALIAVTKEPQGCRFCHAGRLITPNNPEKGHDAGCGFLLAARALLNKTAA